MKWIGPFILLLVIVLAVAIMWFPKAVWPLGGLTVMAVLAAIVVTFVSDVKQHKKECP